MNRVMLDSNIYGEILIDKDVDLIKKRIAKPGLIFYGNELVKKELKSSPKKSGSYAKNLRMDLLRLFDEIVKERVLVVTEEMEKLAEKYYLVYKEVGGSFSKDRMMNDFVIVACATLRTLDLVVSEDNRTMLSCHAIKAYEIVNKLHSKRTPKFLRYKQFKEKIMRWSL